MCTRRIFLCLILSQSCFQVLYSQARAYLDQAQAYNKLLLDNDGATFTRIGKFKVTGSPYFFGTKNNGVVFLKSSKAPINEPISYDTYQQHLEFYPSSNNTTGAIQNFDQVDSFFLATQNWEGAKTKYVFINSNIIGFPKKCFLEILYKGSLYSLLKKYQTDLSVVSTNYIDADLRQFELQIEYYYKKNIDLQVKKIKLTSSSLAKEFKGNTESSKILNTLDFKTDPEKAVIEFFTILNN